MLDEGVIQTPQGRERVKKSTDHVILSPPGFFGGRRISAVALSILQAATNYRDSSPAKSAGSE
jgi:hypothetical protein